MSLTKVDKRYPVEEMPIGTWRNGVGFNMSTATAQLVYPLGVGVADNTRFSVFYVPTSGVFSVQYEVSAYTNGTLQEAIFKYDPLGQLGAQVKNQNWATPAVGTRDITECNMDAGLYYLCLRNSSPSDSIFVRAIGTNTNGTGTVDFGMYMCYYKINGVFDDTSFGNYCYGLWDNATNPAVQANYNGSFSDFSPYQNCVGSNKYLFPIYDTTFYKVRLNRTA